jgi:hypothetical protein
MIMSTTITQHSLERTSLYAVASDSDRPLSSPSTSPVSVGGGDLPLPYDLLNLGDPAAAVAALLAISFQEDRKHAKLASALVESNRLREGEMRVAEMNQKADEIRAEGWARGLSQVLSAACSVNGGIQSLREKEPHKAQALLSLWSEGGKGFEAGGMIIGNDHQADAVNHQAQADLLESRAEASRVARDKFEEEASDARQMLHKIMEFVKEMNEVRNATLQAVASFKA